VATKQKNKVVGQLSAQPILKEKHNIIFKKN